MNVWSQCVLGHIKKNPKVLEEVRYICHHASTPEEHLRKFISEYFAIYYQQPGLIRDLVMSAFERTEWTEIVRHLKTIPRDGYKSMHFRCNPFPKTE